jgi:hypothetical protein
VKGESGTLKGSGYCVVASDLRRGPGKVLGVGVRVVGRVAAVWAGTYYLGKY